MKTLLCLSLCFFTSAAGAVIRVGNGGEGVRKNGALYLRDLFEANLHLNPYIGQSIEPYFETEVQHSNVSRLPIPLDLLARKLTDLQWVSPQLGHYVLAAINSYQWIFVDEPLQPFDDEGSPFVLSERVPLANRFQSTIRLQRSAWRQLSPAHRIALILHEAVYSMIKPVCREDLCKQPSYQAREITALLFSNDPPRPPSLSEQMRDSLTIPEWATTDCAHGSYSLQIQLKITTGFWPFARTLVKKFEMADARDASERIDFLENFCKYEWEPVKSRAQITVNLKREPFRVVTRTYPTTNTGLIYEQSYIGFESQGNFQQAFQDAKWADINFRTCAFLIDSQASLWLSPYPVLNPPTYANTCARR